ncbi:MAG: hypothetical protein ACK4WJ_06330, partial [Endomicrobiia bacterium]
IVFEVYEIPSNTLVETKTASELIRNGQKTGIYFASLTSLNINKSYIVLAVEPDGHYVPILLEKTLMV